MNALESELDTSQYLKCLSDAIDQKDTTSLAAWEALAVLSTFYITSADATSSNQYLYQIRYFFLNLFPIQKIKVSKKGQDDDDIMWDASLAKLQSSHLIQLFKGLVECIYNSKEDLSQNKLHVFRSILVPLIKTILRRDAVYQMKIPMSLTGYDLLTNVMLDIVLDTSLEQSHRLLVLMELLLYLPTIQDGKRIKHTVQHMISHALDSKHDKDIVIAMKTSLSKLIVLFDEHDVNTNDSTSRDIWMWIILNLYGASSKQTQLFESVDKMMWQAISSLSHSALNTFVMGLNAIKSHSREESDIPHWVFVNISLLCYERNGMMIDLVSMKSDGPTTLLEKLIIYPIMEENNLQCDLDINMKDVCNVLMRNDCTFSFNDGKIQHKDTLILINQVSNVVRSCIFPIKNNQKYIWEHSRLFVDLIATTLKSSVSIATNRIQLAILSVSVTIFMDCVDLKKNIVSIVLDVLQRCTGSMEDTLQDFAGHVLVIFSRLLTCEEHNDHMFFTSILIQIAKRYMTSSTHRTILQFVLNALSFSEHGRHWISDHIVSELDSCSTERRSNGILGIESLIGLCSNAQFLDDVHVLQGLRYACEIMQNCEDDLKVNFSTLHLDPWVKERLLNAALLSFIQYFCAESDPSYGCKNFIFIQESEGLNKLPTLVGFILKFLPTDLRIYLVRDQDIPSDIPYFSSVAISCLRSLMMFLRVRSGVSASIPLSFPSSDLLYLNNLPVYESIFNHENSAWSTKMGEMPIDSNNVLPSHPNKVDASTKSFNQRGFPPATRLILCYTFLEESFKWRPHISCIDISHQVNLLLSATGSYFNLDEQKRSPLKDICGLKRFCMLWQLVIGSLKHCEAKRGSSYTDGKEYISNLFPAIQLICSHQAHILQYSKYSSKEALDLFTEIRNVYTLLFIKDSFCRTDFPDSDTFIRDLKSFLLDQLLIILTQIKTDLSKLHPKLDLSFYGTFVSDLGQDLKNSCEGRSGGVTKSLLRCYVALIGRLLSHIEKVVMHAELQVLSWDVIVNLNIVSLLLIDILFSCPMPKSIFKSLSQLGIYQIPCLVRNTKLALLKKRTPSLIKQKAGILDPILVVSTLKKCIKRNDSDNNYVWLSTFCADTIGRLWSESNMVKGHLNIHSIQYLMEGSDASLLDYYREQRTWYQTLLYSICSYSESNSTAQSTPLLNALAMSSARIFTSLKKNVHHLIRLWDNCYDNGLLRENTHSIFESYLAVSTWILFANQTEDATPIKMLQVVQRSDQMKKNKTLVTNFHSHLRKLSASLNEYESHPLIEIMSFVNIKIYGSNELNFASELMVYLDRNGVKPLKVNRKSLSSKDMPNSTTNRSRSVKRSRNQLIDEWLEADHETQDDFEDLEDFLLPG